MTPDLAPKLLGIGTNLVLQRSLGTPCLLHQILAISAQHLAHLRPDRCQFYSRQAVQLQTKAIELFNATQIIDKTNCEATILFVGLLNRHLLIDVLGNREGDAAAFLERFIRSAQVQRGIRVIYNKTSTILLESDLAPLVREGSWAATRSSTVGKECDMLRQLISITPALDPIAKEACRTAVHFLQVGFDELAQSPRADNVFRLIFCWGAYFPNEFFDLLSQRRPEAVAVLGWYAVLLDSGRTHWAIGDAAVFVLRSVSCFLGPEWAHWLQWPMEMLADRLPE
ncbi:hypothetical protein M406DRAFT_332314 [Cryphonectria parasitica EP155]|uniref:Uncharacterized protein n=1 Tax=Cryphonectria parasitica (strain ATCC 38755 / EP155) TaxID=660469 RepID=A0A9P4XYV4_CRYP1|nr:uncharacterized protein M406DRAFT_332314 [Cryphonectria parasitica EP155]KAF3763867.1 hypothetical protein M406DRAFT_332314 [Cryphonectria parasitica EP155]